RRACPRDEETAVELVENHCDRLVGVALLQGGAQRREVGRLIGQQSAFRSLGSRVIPVCREARALHLAIVHLRHPAGDVDPVPVRCTVLLPVDDVHPLIVGILMGIQRLLRPPFHRRVWREPLPCRGDREPHQREPCCPEGDPPPNPAAPTSCRTSALHLRTSYLYRPLARGFRPRRRKGHLFHCRGHAGLARFATITSFSSPRDLSSPPNGAVAPPGAARSPAARGSAAQPLARGSAPFADSLVPVARTPRPGPHSPPLSAHGATRRLRAAIRASLPTISRRPRCLPHERSTPIDPDYLASRATAIHRTM